MAIQIKRPEIEALINQRLQTGGFKDAEDVVFQALQSSSAKDMKAQHVDELFSAMDRMASIDGPTFMSPEAVASEIAAMRAERRVKNPG